MMDIVGDSVSKIQHYFSLLKQLSLFFFLGSAGLLAQGPSQAAGTGPGEPDSSRVAAWGDVVFNEVMADPNPPVDFDREYLEVYNRSTRVLDLADWILQVNTRTYSLSASMMTGGTRLPPGSYGVVLDPGLPNEGATLSLYDPLGNLVHAARYRAPWNGADWKKEGGWSLESPDPEQVCRISGLWAFSVDPAGGTPGKINSTHAMLTDLEGPVLLYPGYGPSSGEYLGEGEPGLIRLYFSEPLVMCEAELQQIKLWPGDISPLEAHILPPLSRVMELRFPVDLQNRPNCKIRIPRVRDCQGNERLSQEAVAGSVSDPVSGSVLINEIMYDPAAGFPEYIELTLPEHRVYDLRDLAIHAVETGGLPDDPVALSDHSRIAEPGSFVVLTRCAEHLRDVYHLERSGQWVELEGWNNLKNGGGTLYLTDRAGKVVDRADYGDHLHAPILADTRGISLERISLAGSGSDPGNWHSAASIEGYATPGRINSQARIQPDPGPEFRLEPTVFSPDNDGYQDLLEITVCNGVSGWITSLWITDLQGNLVRQLANNHLSGVQDVYFWDGTYGDGSMVPTGIYVVHARAYHPGTGERWIRKGAVGVVYR
jgi:hypothetical protein